MMRAATAALLLLLGGGLLAAQEVRTAVVPQTIHIGDVFQVVVRVSGDAGAGLAFPDSLELPADLESAGPRQLRTDTTSAGERRTAVYAVTAWRPGRYVLPPATITLRAGTALRTAPAAFPEIQVASVLPADTAGVQPRPPKDVMGGNRVWWPWLLLLALLAAVAAALLFYYRKHRARPPAALPPVPASARTLALEALERARASGALEAGDLKRFYSDVSAAVRAFLAAEDGRLGLDLTTTEVLRALRGRARSARLPELRALLAAADLVKFAGHRPALPAAEQDWQRARDWVLGYETSGLENAA